MHPARAENERSARPGARSRFSAAPLLVAWILVVLTVQPWSGSAERSTTADSGGALKGALLLACIGLLAARATTTTRFRVPPFVAIYMVYGTVLTVASIALDHPGETVVRAARLTIAMLVPILAWPLVRRRPALMVDAHLVAYSLLAALVLVGAVVVPDRAWHQTTGSGGDRLMGAILPMMPPRVGEIGAVLVGLTVLGVLGRRVRPALGVALVGAGLTLLVLSRTRTAAVALVLALLLAFVVARRSALGRRGLWIITVTAIATIPVAPLVGGWLTRAQSVEQIATLSGRTTVWEFIARSETTASELWWGRGLGQKRVVLRRGEGDIDVMAIDNTWLGAYWEAGVVAVVLIVLAVLVLGYLAVTSPGAYVRATSTFLVVFVLGSTFSESGLSDVSSQTLSLVVAAVAVHADRHGQGRQDELDGRRRRPAPGETVRPISPVVPIVRPSPAP
ncbi:hypothetical protein J4G33_00585 [Actinotalea sp. BY-33]|uniref:O-antigen ligase domain-containing protein n=1 Tax=Actinotalea soli TaxID=2819234 RepID=A0A939RT23_9CELL|nr:hypothetical protein [Actinotalea soli]MBO1750294.1 hypothetical protein [Actinotalea soli]